MDRRMFLKQTGGVAVLALGMTSFGRTLGVAAQGTPASGSPFASLGLPEITVTLTESGFSVSPAETPAGWTLLTAINQLSGPDAPEDGVGFDVLRIPDGETADSILAPVPGASEDDPPPAMVYEAVWAGGPWTTSGSTSQAVVLLEEGNWLIWSAGDPPAPAALTVTAAGGAATAPSLTADVTVTEQNFAFTGLDGTIPAGGALWKVTNESDQPHLLFISKAADGATQADLDATIGSFMSGTPAANPVDLGGNATVGGSSSLSIDQTTWLWIDLEAGTYTALCWFPDKESGMPHAMMGMATVFTVA